MQTNKAIVAIIPARSGSKSIPGKNIIPLLEKPLIAWTIQQALASKYIKGVYVSTDDEKIASISTKYGASIIKRPSKFATDASPSEEALLHAISKIERRRKIDIVVFLQATSPIREAGDIDNAIEKFISEKADSLFSAAVLEDFCIWENKNNKWHSVTFDYTNRKRRQDRQPYYLENGSIYIFKPEILRKYSNRLGDKISVYFMDYWKSFEIDKPDDITLCAHFIKDRIIKSRTKIELNKVDLIVYDFDGVMTDNAVFISRDGKETVTVNRGDGMAVGILRKKGIPQLILSTEVNDIVKTRAEKMCLPVLYNIKNKKARLTDYCRENRFSLKKLIYVGNDINDIDAMRSVGFPVCPADAAEEVKNISKIVLAVPGGRGAIRDLLNYIKF